MRHVSLAKRTTKSVRIESDESSLVRADFSFVRSFRLLAWSLGQQIPRKVRRPLADGRSPPQEVFFWNKKYGLGAVAVECAGDARLNFRHHNYITKYVHQSLLSSWCQSTVKRLSFFPTSNVNRLRETSGRVTATSLETLRKCFFFLLLFDRFRHFELGLSCRCIRAREAHALFLFCFIDSFLIIVVTM